MTSPSFFQRAIEPERIVRSLGLVTPFGLDDLLAATERWRKRPLCIKDCPLPPEFSALWVETAKADHLVVATGLILLQREQAIVHELAHILLEHRPRVVTSPAELQEALGVPASMHALARSGYHYGGDEEVQAEYLATVICMGLQHGSCQEQDERAERFRHYLG